MSQGNMDPEPIDLPDGQMQHGRMRRQRVMKELRRGRLLSAEDLPVASAMVGQERTRQRWLIPIFAVMAGLWLSDGVNEPGAHRWVSFALFAGCVLTIWLNLREQRRLIRNFEQQNTPEVDDHQDEVAS